jgi:Raf kinase inhibitor-like YbhB/YbcL family protein
MSHIQKNVNIKKLYNESKRNYLNLKSLLNSHEIFHGGNLEKTRTHHVMTISSRSIDNNGIIDDKFAKKSGNVSPSISIKNVPASTKKLALVVYDPDAIKVVKKIFLHWFVILDPTMTELSEGTNAIRQKQMLNDSGKKDYYGPSPPPGQTHTYHFKVFAITDELSFDPNVYYSYDKINDMLKDYENAEFVAKYRTKSIL